MANPRWWPVRQRKGIMFRKPDRILYLYPRKGYAVMVVRSKKGRFISVGLDERAMRILQRDIELYFKYKQEVLEERAAWALDDMFKRVGL